MGTEHGKSVVDQSAVRKEQSMEDKRFKEINCNVEGCMDGRPVLFKARKVNGKWEMVVSVEKAGEVVEAKLPGGALGLIAVLEQVAHLPQDRAIEVAEQALEKLGMAPQIHIDNDHGHFDVTGKTEAELLEFVEKQVGGCGFAGLIWEEGAPALITKLKERGWLIEVLDGHHEEKDAISSSEMGKAIDAKAATAEEHQSFTFNRAETQKVFEAIEQVLTDTEKVTGFVDQSLAWHDKKFADIADLLRKIKTVETR